MTAEPLFVRPFGRIRFSFGGSLARAAVVGLMALGLARCAPVNVTRPDVSRAPQFPAFARQPDDRPVISSGRAGLPLIPLDPVVYVDAEGYHLFYTTLFCRREYGYGYAWDPSGHGSCDIAHTITTVAYAFSADRGLTWEFRRSPVVMPAASGFDSGRLETPYVFKIGETLYLAFSAEGDRKGKPFTSRYQIGLAKLDLGNRSLHATMMDEGERFQLRSTPLLSYDLDQGRFDNNVQEPSVVVSDQGIELYYIGLGLRLPDDPMDAPGQEITSMGMGRAVLDSAMDVLSRSSKAVIDGINITEVRRFEGAYQLFATLPDSGDFHRGSRLAYATSHDGVHWSSPRVILPPTVQGLDDWGEMSPTVAVSGTQLVLFYDAFAEEGHPCLMRGPGGRFGKPVANGEACVYTTIARAVSRLPE